MTDLQNAAIYSTENVGAAFATPSGESKRANLYSVENVGAAFGKPLEESKAANLHSIENVGAGWRKPDDSSSNANLYSEFNALTDVLVDGPLWVEAAAGEAFWEPGLIWNGCEFVRYHMWDGNCWQGSSSSPIPTLESSFPTAVTTTRATFNGSGGSVTLPAFPTGMTSAVALIALATHTTINAPAGWNVLGTTQVWDGSTGLINDSQIRRCIVVALDNPTGLESRTFTFANAVADNYNGAGYVTAYFTGGPTGGTWTAAKGQEFLGSSQARFTPIVTTDGVPNLWWQVGVSTAVYTYFSAPPGVEGGGNGFIEPWLYPTSASGEAFRTNFLNAKPYDLPDIIDTDNIGAYGRPCSTSWGLKWTPPVSC